jgi:hypothetical protein
MPARDVAARALAASVVEAGHTAGARAAAQALVNLMEGFVRRERTG